MSFGDLELDGHYFLEVNRSGPGTSSTINLRLYRALGLHGPWCKQPLRIIIIF